VKFRSYLSIMLVAMFLTASSLGQNATAKKNNPPLKSRKTPAACSVKRLDKCALDVAKDQAGIWTSPLRVHTSDARWLVPFAGATGASIYYDKDAMTHIGTSTTQQDFGRNISKYSSPYVSFGTAGGIYLVGAVTHNDHIQETGLLGAESVVDASLLAFGLKLATNRDRPYQEDGTGKFWPHGMRAINTDGSMASGHAAAAWALARVVSMEYPDRPLLKLLAYGSALTVSSARVMSRDHFPSDVIVGSTFGFLTGGYVMRHHSRDYKDSFSYSLAPSMGGLGGSYALSLTITPPEDFDLCRALQIPGVHFLRKIDSGCASTRR